MLNYRANTQKDTKVLQLFRKTSFCQTMLILRDGRKLIRKVAPLGYKSKLANQAAWLSDRQDSPVIPKAIDFFESGSEVILDLEYIPKAKSFFEFIHENDNSTNEKVLFAVVDFLKKYIHGHSPIQTSFVEAKNYIEKKVETKIYACSQIIPDLKKVFKQDVILIDGEKYLNFPKIFDLIEGSQEAMECIATSRSCPQHGDLTVENILISPQGFHIIDPNDENFLSTPLIDFSKLMQSLNSGYEFMEAGTSSLSKDGEIKTCLEISLQYQYLNRALDDSLRQSLHDREYKALRFHHAVHFSRLLTYKAKYRPENFWIYYAAFVKKMNEFYAQFD